MKRLIAVIACMAMLCTVLTGCGAGDTQSVAEKIQKKLTNMETYKSLARVKQISNKGEKEYEIVHWAKVSGEYRMEIVAPEKVSGTVTVYNGQTTMQYNPNIEGSLKVDLPVSQIRSELLLGTFLKNYMQSEGVSIAVSKLENSETTVLEAVIPGDHPYMSSEKLWVDNETLLPSKLVIYDNKGGERIIVLYKEFEYNIKLEDNLFTVSQ